jgi:oxygen-independent coproporphyrinogen-3 oxidase
MQPSFEYVYVHLPFCEVICHYCDFYTARNKDARHEDLFAALHLELESYRSQLATTLKAIYFGGGTPGLSPTPLLKKFLGEFSSHINPETEITLEVNPNNVNREIVSAWREAGINRLSMGIQSLRDDLLKKLGRTHSGEDAMNALKLCAETFSNVSGDLIYGVPGQENSVPAEEAERMADLGLTHLSAYHLSLSPQHFLFSKLPEDNIAFEQIKLVSERLAQKGFEHYEISNFAKPGKESRNNSNYWHGGAYLALGPSAHGFDGNALRWHNIANWEEYCTRLQSGKSVIVEKENLSLEQRKIEYLFTRLRLQSGINLKEFETLFGVSLEKEKTALFEDLKKMGLGELGNGHFLPSFRGRMLGDELVQKFL